MATAEEKAAAKAAKEAEAAAAKAAKEAEKAAAKAAKEAAEGDGTQVTIKFRDHTGQVTARVFSEEQHGKDFKSLADEFRKKHAARIVA